MVKNKKPFINKKNASTYQLIHRSQRDVAPDHHDTNNNNNNTGTGTGNDSSGRMILWPKEDNIHSTTLPSTDRAVLMGMEEEEEEDEVDPGGRRQTSNQNHNIDSTTNGNGNSILSWKQQLQQMGVLDTVDHEAFLRPITGTGIFLDANHGGRPVSSTTPSTTTHVSSTTNNNNNQQRNPPLSATTESESFVVNDAILEVNRVMESLPLTTDCMDEDIAAILFAENAGDDDDENNNMFEDYEELNDDFIFMATGVIPIEAGDNDHDNSHTDDGTPVTAAQRNTNFDFDAHIQQLINTAKLGRDTMSNKNKRANHPDEDFFAKHWQKPLKHIHEDHDDDDEDEDEGENYRNITKDRYLSYANDEENSVMGGGSSVYTTTTTFTTTGAAKLLNPDEERALCDKFAATLAEYDDDSNDDYNENDDGNEYRFGNNTLEEENGIDNDDDESKTIQSSSFQCATIGRPLVGDAIVEAALDEYLLEREDDILIHGNADRMRRSGGSGFAVLVGKQMINAKVLDTSTMPPSSSLTVEEMYPEQEPAIPIDEYIAIAQERLLQPKEKPPAEEIFIDGKSYYEERPRNPWDCESILSTYSNLDNNPITIGQSSTRRRRKNMIKSKDDHSVVSSTNELDHPHPNFTPQHIRLSTKTGLPIGVFEREHAPASNDDDSDGDDDDHGDDTFMSVNKGIKRRKDETPEEKRVRKLMIKRERELARIQKKITKEIYNTEMQKHMPMISEDHMSGKTVFRFS